MLSIGCHENGMYGPDLLSEEILWTGEQRMLREDLGNVRQMTEAKFVNGLRKEQFLEIGK